MLYSSFGSSRRNSDSVLCFCSSGESVWPCPRKVLCWAMGKVGVEEWMVHLVQAMYDNERSRVRVGSEYSEEFEVGVGVHQGSVLSPLLFIIVFDALYRDLRVGVPWQLFFADDLVIIAISHEECVERVKAWKEGLESKGLHVNLIKTKFMDYGLGLDIQLDSGKFPCTVCHTGVGEDMSYECLRCRGEPGQVYALSTATLSRRLWLVTVYSKRLILSLISATWVTCSVLVVAVWLLPLLDAGVPGVSFEKTSLCSRPSLCLST